MKQEFFEAIKNDPTWADCLSFFNNPEATVHVAVMVEPFLSSLLAGRKTIESRFSRHKIAPYQKTAPGDLVLLKQSSGPVVGSFEVAFVRYLELTSKTLKELEANYERQINGSKEFWQAQQTKRYASLFGVKNIQPRTATAIQKQDPRGWVVLNGL